MHADLMTALLGSATRYKLMRYLASSPEPVALTDIAHATDSNGSLVQRTLKPLIACGLVLQTGRPGRWMYQLPTDPKLKPLLQLLDPTAYIVRQLQSLFEDDPEIEAAAIFGSIAKGTERPDSDVDLLVIGTADELDLAVKLRPLGRDIGRPIHPICYTREALADRIANDSSFVDAVLAGKLLTVKGHIHACTAHPADSEPTAKHPDRC